MEKEAPTPKEWAAKQGPRAGEIKKLYRSRTASVLKTDHHKTDGAFRTGL